MVDRNYSKREIDEHFREVKEILARIESQTTKTNGRVNNCEDDIMQVKTTARVVNWAFGLTVPIILTMSVWVFFNQINSVKETINSHIHSDEVKWDLVFNKLGI